MTDVRVPLVLICLALFSACYEPQEGCLDPYATNYDVSADINSECTYPVLNIAVAHTWNGEPFSYDSTYIDASGEAYRITFMGFFLRDFQLMVENEGWVPVTTKTNRILLQNGEHYSYPEEIILVEDRNFQSVIDSITVYEPWSSIRAELGLDLLAMADSSNLDNNHPLNRRNAMSPSGSNIYYDYVIGFLPDTGDMDSRRWIYGQIEDSLLISFPKDTIFEPAMNAELTFDLFYDRLFSGFRVDMTDEAIMDLWEQNLPAAMEVR